MTVNIRITPAVADEYDVREMAECYEGEHNAYAKVSSPGTYDFTSGEAAELLDDAENYTDPSGPGMYLTAGQRNAFRALSNQIRKALS